MNSDSGVVTSTCGGLRSMRCRSAAVVSPVRTAVRIGARPMPRSPARLQNFAERYFEILAHVVRERFERRDVDDERFDRAQIAGGRAAHQTRRGTCENAASVLPEPVGAEISTSRPARRAASPEFAVRSGSTPRREPLAEQRMKFLEHDFPFQHAPAMYVCSRPPRRNPHGRVEYVRPSCSNILSFSVTSWNAAPKRATAPEPARAACSAIRCASICTPAFRCSRPKNCIPNRSCHELLWFLRGQTNVRYLHEHGVTIWDEWADENGDLGPVYGEQWRSWPRRRQRRSIRSATSSSDIKRNPDSRRLIVSAWNVGELDEMALAPCHLLFQFYVADGRLSCQFYQRSADAFLGVPFNIASYALLTHMIAHQCHLEPGRVRVDRRRLPLVLQSLGASEVATDAHPLPPPALAFKRRPHSLFDYRYEDIVFAG